MTAPTDSTRTNQPTEGENTVPTTNTTDVPEAATTAPDAPEDAQPQEAPNEAPDDAHDGKAAGREAARYRRQLRDTEAERDTLKARVAALQTAEVRRVAGAKLADADDLFAVGGVTLGDLLDDDGNVDPGAIAAAMDIMLTTRPRLAKDWQPIRRDEHQGRKDRAYFGDVLTDAFRAR